MSSQKVWSSTKLFAPPVGVSPKLRGKKALDQTKSETNRGQRLPVLVFGADNDSGVPKMQSNRLGYIYLKYLERRDRIWARWGAMITNSEVGVNVEINRTTILPESGNFDYTCKDALGEKFEYLTYQF